MRTLQSIPVLLGAVAALVLVGTTDHSAPVSPNPLAGAHLPAGAPAPGWRHADIWNDGKAEFSVYHLKWPRYGTLNAGRVVLVAVKEAWSPTLEVKAERPGEDSFDIIKLNHIRDVRTGIYEYHQMASVFLRRDDGSLRKLAATSSEGCGLTTSYMAKGELRTRSYFDGQGSRTTTWPAGAVSEDGLALHLRDYVLGIPPATLDVFPSLMSGRLPALETRRFKVAGKKELTVTVPAGTFVGVEIRLEDRGAAMVYTFEKAVPHRLLEFQSTDGTQYLLAKSERIPYWTMNRPGGEQWLPEDLR